MSFPSFSASAAITKQEAANAKEYGGLRGRLQGYVERGPPGAELWLFELLYLHNASAANSMPEAWHEVGFCCRMDSGSSWVCDARCDKCSTVNFGWFS